MKAYIFNEMVDEACSQSENDLIFNIIKIYEGCYSSYEQYIKVMYKINEHIRKLNGIERAPYKFQYHPEQIIISDKLFNFIMRLRDYNFKEE